MTMIDPEIFASRIVSVAQDILAPGPMGNRIRGAEYREFVRCGWPLDACMLSPPDEHGKRSTAGDIGKIHTSCAVFAGSVLWHAGLPFEHMRVWSMPMVDNWLQMGFDHESWAPFPAQPGKGDVFFVGNPKGKNGHVGILLAEKQPGLWITAEGGGGTDGTKCAIKTAGRRFDSANRFAFERRGLLGFWKASVLARFAREPKPAVPGPPVTAPSQRLLMLTNPHQRGADVEWWQGVLGMHVTGIFDETTDALTRVWQREHGLNDDGKVGRITKAAARTV